MQKRTFEVTSEKLKTEEQQRDDIQKIYNFCRQYFKQYKKFPKLIKIANASGLSNEQIKLVLKFLISKNYLKIYGKNYYFPEQEIKKRTIKKPFINAKKTQKTKINFKILLLFIVLGVVGVIATLISIYYTKLWFDNMMNFIMSFALSICIVGFSIGAFELIILLKNNKQIILSFIFSILWVIVLLFSMTSTIAGQYNQFREKQISFIIENNDNTNLYYEELLNQEKSLQIDIEDKIKERKRYINILQEFNTNEEIKENEIYVNKYRNIIYFLDKDIKKIKIELNKIIEEKKKILKNNKNIKNLEKEDFFIWASKILKISPFIIQFWLSLFPAIFIDIIAPLSFAVILFFKNNY